MSVMMVIIQTIKYDGRGGLLMMIIMVPIKTIIAITIKVMILIIKKWHQ